MKPLILLVIAIAIISACSSTRKNSGSTDAALTGTYWKLTELMGKPIVYKTQQKEAHIMLNKETGRLNGNAGCNVINGSFSLQDPNRIAFSQMISTQMACPDMETESQFLKIISMTDSYYIKGDTLQLIRAKMAPLAKLQAVTSGR